MEGLVLIVMLATLAIYMFPAIVAGMRGHMSFGAIAVLTLLGGWTVLLWILALIWALTGDTRANFERRLRRGAPE